MSRRNSSSRRRAYGRRLHEMHERRPRHEARLEWLDDTPGGEFDAARADHLAYDEYPRGSGGGPRP